MKSNYLVICCYHILTYSFNTYLCPDVVKFLINVDEKVSVLILNFQLLNFLNLCDRFNCHLKWNIHSLRKKVILKESREKESLKKNRRGGKEKMFCMCSKKCTQKNLGGWNPGVAKETHTTASNSWSHSIPPSGAGFLV